MFGSIGGAELLLILALALLLFGPRKLPHLGRSLGRALAEFRSASHEFRSSLEREVELERLKETRGELSAATREIGQAVSSTHGAAVAAAPANRREGEAGASAPPLPADDGSPQS